MKTQPVQYPNGAHVMARVQPLTETTQHIGQEHPNWGTAEIGSRRVLVVREGNTWRPFRRGDA